MILGLLTALGVAFLLGLRHATDPDHLTAVSTLVLGNREGGARRASRLGLAWGAGHATTLLAAGVPVVLSHALLPDTVQRLSELAVGVIIVALAVRLLVRCRRGVFHIHTHAHDGVLHAHPHVHEHGTREYGRDTHEHAHPESLGRSPRAAYGIGLVHGLGGSAAVGLLLIASLPGRGAAVAALVVFATATAISMSIVSALWGHVLQRGMIERRLARLAPALGVASLVFGAMYGALAMT
jgi:high-affinity nickel permease